MGYNIAIDGPAGAGKSTIAKKVAEKLGFIYIDTGAMYRSVGLYFSRNHVDVKDPEAVEKALGEIDIKLAYEDGLQHVILNGEDVSSMIRTTEAGNMASTVGTLGPVRQKLVAMQQKLAAENDSVLDGRDICTVVLPHADVKVYLTASVEVRAERRLKDYQKKGLQITLEEVADEVRKRDEQDMNREIAPLRKADDAELVDSSFMTIDQVVDAIIGLTKHA